jgi:putative phosphotransacetylase
MTKDELDRLADLIAKALERGAAAREPSAGGAWVPAPVRPEPPGRPGEPAPWTGAGQALGDVAPVRQPSPSRHRADAGELAAVTRAAAAGRRPAPARAPTPRTEPAGRRRARAFPITVRIGVSNRHLHLSEVHLQALFGTTSLTSARAILQPGQFAAAETVTAVGPKGTIDRVRVVGPARGETQLELAMSDAVILGVDAPVAASGSLDASAGGVTLVGPHGRVALARGVIIAARHLHCAPADASRWGLRDGDRLDIRCGRGARAATLHDVLVRSGPAHATELHLDADEARAAGVVSGETAQLIAWREGAAAGRTLVTERDVIAIARGQGQLPRNALLTPSARDRARTLGLLES